MIKKFSGLAFSLELVLVIIFFTITFSFGVIMMNTIITNQRVDMIKNCCDSVDKRNHLAVKVSTLKVTETPDHKELVKYEQGPVYPTDLNELGLLESQFGYLSFSAPIVQASAWNNNYNAEVSTIKQSFIADAQHGGFEIIYTTNKIDGNVMSYTLTAVLPNGTTYYSPHSKR